MTLTEKDVTRFRSKMGPRTSRGCRLWQGCAQSTDTKKGIYGCFTAGGKNLRAHRVSYRIHRGPIPKGKKVLHHCDFGFCVEPSHLYAGTQRENMDDKARRGRAANIKLTVKIVRSMRRLHARGNSLSSIGRTFGVHAKTVSCAVKGVTWRRA